MFEEGKEKRGEREREGKAIAPATLVSATTECHVTESAKMADQMFTFPDLIMFHVLFHPDTLLLCAGTHVYVTPAHLYTHREAGIRLFTFTLSPNAIHYPTCAVMRLPLPYSYSRYISPYTLLDNQGIGRGARRTRRYCARISHTAFFAHASYYHLLTLLIDIEIKI